MSNPAAELIKLHNPETDSLWKFPILWEDEHVLAINKPAGILTIHDPGYPEHDVLIPLLKAEISRGRAIWLKNRSISFLKPLNFLDLHASGVLLMGKNTEAEKSIKDQLNADNPLETYLGIIDGIPKSDEFEIDLKLLIRPFVSNIVKVTKQGKKSRSIIKVTEKFQGYSIISAWPVTRRKEQLQAHLAFRNHPLVGDSKYGGQPLLLSEMKRRYRPNKYNEERPLLDRPALHLKEIRFESTTHPGESVTIEAPLPKDMKAAIRYLQRYSQSWTQEPQTD